MLPRTPAADRLLRAASVLFAAEGIRSVGIDRILATAGVAKATLYQAFGSKEALVVAYIEQRDISDRRAYRTRLAGLPPGPARILAPFDVAERAAGEPRYLGCIYANALNEFPQADGPIAAAVRHHREWVHEQWAEALAPREHAARLAASIQIVYDGALLGAKAAQTPEPIRLARTMVGELLGEHSAPVPAAAVATRPARRA